MDLTVNLEHTSNYAATVTSQPAHREILRPEAAAKTVPSNGSRTAFDTFTCFAILNLLGGIAVAVVSSYAGELEPMLSLVFMIEAFIAVISFLLIVRWLRS